MPVALRSDFDALQLRTIRPQDKGWAAGAALVGSGFDLRRGGVTLQIVRDWVMKFNAHGPNGRIDKKAPGQPSKLEDTHRAALAKIIDEGPIPAIHGVVRWRLIDLCQWIFVEFCITLSPQTLSRELHKMGFRKLSARPRHHAQADGAIEDFKKVSPRAWRPSRRRKASIPAT